MLSGVSQANVMNAVAVGGGIIASNIVGNMVAARTTNVLVVDAVTGLAGLLLIGMGTGPVKAVGAGIAGMAAARVINRYVFAAA